MKFRSLGVSATHSQAFRTRARDYVGRTLKYVGREMILSSDLLFQECPLRPTEGQFSLSFLL